MCGIFAGSAECAQAMIIVLTIYAALFISAIIGGAIFWIHKKREWAIWWASVMINLFCSLYFLGNSTLIGWLIRVFSLTAWPITNTIWLFDLIYRERKAKYGKKKKFLGIF